MGNGWLTARQLEERDRLVFETAKRIGLPVAWNLAGGYGAMWQILNLHAQTMRACAEAYLAAPVMRP